VKKQNRTLIVDRDKGVRESRGKGHKGADGEVVERQNFSELAPAFQRAAKLAEEKAKRKEAEEALRKSEQRCAELLANLETVQNDFELRLSQLGSQYEEAVKELEGLSYSISHDLRAPVRHIDGFTEMLQRAAQKELSPDNHALLEVIGHSSRLMARMIEGLLAFSRLGRMEIAPESTDANEVVRILTTELDMAYRGRNIVWTIEKLPMLEVNRKALREIFLHLLANAIKFTQPKPKARIEVGAKVTAAEVTFHVRDNGVGFNPEYTHKLFGIFQRLHSSDQFEGLGIGLASVRRILSRLGGRVWVEAREEQGACFYFTLPKQN
jgi:light-regulated signal transduction histidine kinase (bacteriophytochrome)